MINFPKTIHNIERRDDATSGMEGGRWLLRYAIIMIFAVFSLMLASCGGGGPDSGSGSTITTGADSTGISRTSAESVSTVMNLEAENGSVSGGATIQSKASGYSGAGYVYFGTSNSAASVTWPVTVSSAGAYTISVVAQVPSAVGASKKFPILVDSMQAGTVTINNDSTWHTVSAANVFLTAGTHAVSVGRGGGYFYLDRLMLTPLDPLNVAIDAPVLTRGDATANRLYAYLRDQYGKGIIAGQMDTSWSDSVDMVGKVYASTGKYPALKGFDFINLNAPSGWGGAGSEQTYEALAWWNGRNGSGKATSSNYNSFGSAVSSKHGIVAFCWHWRVPLAPGSASDNATDSFRVYDPVHHPDGTTFLIPMNQDGTLNTTSPDFSLLQSEVDTVATQLQILKNNGVPVLWRPLHEASGGWFWWGAARSDGVSAATAYKALYKWLYNYLTTTKGLTNLIWVWNGQDADWYPGNSYVDVAGYDVYGTPADYQSQISAYLSTVTMAGASPYRLVAMTENGTIPSPSNMQADEAYWSWFMTWNDSINSGTSSTNFWEGGYYNSDTHKSDVYSSNYVITLDKLPDLSIYSY
ncbi:MULTISPECIES: glycosyl hydrolase [unclassified Burkholderia]|uniref:glycosyl hydrolase n=1 Tax=unclassified Burkholderia TaxID=2613784 RepID=UPI000F5855E2|nr:MULTISPECIES: glycosyl hydrolase [unclassified Burkholderia]RQS26446.1 hypothetical protein DIE05_20770 [Burkholderia sp. Bp8995]RQS48424.1 hypothetical protein DIE00_10750 [Burkholderia sp. Bp8989]